MRTRATSAEAYKEIRDSGLLKNLQLQVYEALYTFGPCTANELYRQAFSNNNTNSANLGARLFELREFQVAYEQCKRVCSITKKRAIVWDLTDKLPVKPPKKKTKEQKKVEILNELRVMYKELDKNEYIWRGKISNIAYKVKDL